VGDVISNLQLYASITRVLPAGKYIAKDDYTNVLWKVLLEGQNRGSTLHVSEITAIANEFGNSAKIIVPRSWMDKRIIAFLHSEYISKHPKELRKDE
jgi:hypothetical protein